jgi:DNA polymerase III alpha subunit
MRELWVELNKRLLRFDGVSIVEPSELPWLFKNKVSPSKIRVLDTSSDVDQYNTQVSEAEQLRSITNEPVQLTFAWDIPESFKTLDVEAHVVECLAKRIPELQYDDALIDKATLRIGTELRLFKDNGLMDLLRTICYVLDVFEKRNIVWGVGRGSSCASYLLFIIGLHEVDPIVNDIDITDFFHTDE